MNLMRSGDGDAEGCTPDMTIHPATSEGCRAVDLVQRVSKEVTSDRLELTSMVGTILAMNLRNYMPADQHVNP